VGEYGKHESAVMVSTIAAAALTTATPAKAAMRLAPIGTAASSAAADAVLGGDVCCVAAVVVEDRRLPRKAADRMDVKRATRAVVEAAEIIVKDGYNNILQSMVRGCFDVVLSSSYGCRFCVVGSFFWWIMRPSNQRTF
jgi:hypothetical protein